MILEIVTPEQTVFSGKVDAVAVPGINGDFQMLDNHAPVVSILVKGEVRVNGQLDLTEGQKDLFVQKNGAYHYTIQGGVIEMKNNKAIVLAD